MTPGSENVSNRRIFVAGADLTSGELHVTDADLAHHLVNVLRIAQDEEIVVLDGCGRAALCKVVRANRRDLVFKPLGTVQVPVEPKPAVTVAQAVGRGGRFESVLQHATEVGAAAFIPLYSARTVVRRKSDDMAAERRWRTVLVNASEQCGRGRVPVLHPAAESVVGVCESGNYSPILLLQQHAMPVSEWMRNSADCQSVDGTWVLIVGPEGGFTRDERADAASMGATEVSVGAYTLRTETAAVAALAIILNTPFEPAMAPSE